MSPVADYLAFTFTKYSTLNSFGWNYLIHWTSMDVSSNGEHLNYVWTIELCASYGSRSRPDSYIVIGLWLLLLAKVAQAYFGPYMQGKLQLSVNTFLHFSRLWQMTENLSAQFWKQCLWVMGFFNISIRCQIEVKLKVNNNCIVSEDDILHSIDSLSRKSVAVKILCLPHFANLHNAESMRNRYD